MKLVPDSWCLQEEKQCCDVNRHIPRLDQRSPLVECYAALAATLTFQYSEKALELMAYLGPSLGYREAILGMVGSLKMPGSKCQSAAFKFLDLS